MSIAKTCLVIVHDVSRQGSWILESTYHYPDVWQALSIGMEPVRMEQHQVFELKHPLTSEDLRDLQQLKQSGLIFNFYVRDEITTSVSVVENEEEGEEEDDSEITDELAKRLGFDPRNEESLKAWWQRWIDEARGKK